MLAEGIIEHGTSPWAAPVVVVPKPAVDGKPQYRFCVSYVKLNAVTKKDAYPIHRADAVPQFLQGKRWFSAMDLTAGFHQIPLSPEDSLKTGFVCHRGHFVFKVLPFGLANAPAFFQRVMDHTMGELLYNCVFQYIDDTLTYSVTFADHVGDLRKVRDKLAAGDLRIRLRKCHFFKTEVEYLGHLFSREGVKPMEKNLQGVKDFATPTSVKGVRSFLGVVGYYRDHISHFAEKARPLFQLLKKHVIFEEHWTKEHFDAFNQIKEELTNSPFLRFPDANLPYILSSDTSDFATGAVLSQEFPIDKSADLQEVAVEVNEEQQVKLRQKVYEDMCLFSPKYQLSFQVNKDVWYSVEHYILFKQAEFYGLTSIAEELKKLKPKNLLYCDSFASSLSALRLRLFKELEDVDCYPPEGWNIVEASEWYLGTLAKFYCQPSATEWLLRAPDDLRWSKDQFRDAEKLLNDKILKAVKLKFQALVKANVLPTERKIYHRYPIAFYSSTLAPAETSYDARERELLGILRAALKFDPFIYRCKELIIENDHKNLSYLYSGEHSGRLQRWSEKLQRFAPFTVLHVPGFLQNVPDGLSRYLTSCYEVKDLKDLLYSTTEDHRPPTKEVLEILRQRLPPEVKTVYDPFVVHSSTSEGWKQLGIQMLEEKLNFFDVQQRPNPDQYDALVSVGPFTDVNETVKAFESSGKPWAMLLPTAVLSHPKYELHKVQGLQVLSILAFREFPERNKRNLPLQQVWITNGLSLNSPLELVPLENIQEGSSDHIPGDIRVVLPPTTLDNCLHPAWKIKAPLNRHTRPVVTKANAIRISPRRCEANLTLCRDFKRGQCNREHCKFVHSSPEALANPVKVTQSKSKAAPKKYSKKLPVLYEIEEILDHRTRGDGEYEYKIRWKGYSPSDDSWEPESGIQSSSLQYYWENKSGIKEPEANFVDLDPPPKHADHGTDAPKQLRKELLEVEQKLGAIPPGKKPHAKAVLEDRIEQLLQLLEDWKETSSEETQTNHYPLAPDLPLEVPRTHQFRIAQLHDPEIRPFLLQSAQLEPAEQTLPDLPLRVVCRGQYPETQKLLLLRLVQCKTEWEKSFDQLTLMSDTEFDFPVVKDSSQAALLLTKMMVSNHSNAVDPISDKRFRIKQVQEGTQRFQYLEIQLTRNETSALSLTEDFQHIWVKPQKVRTEVISIPAAMYVHGIRNSIVTHLSQPTPDALVVKDGVLYYLHPATREACVIVPQAMRLKLLFLAHDTPTSGHRGSAATLRALQRLYWWPGMRKDVYHYCSGCLRCHKAKATRPSRHRFGHLQPYSLVPPGHTLHIDHFGPFVPSKDGNTVVLTVVDRATGYVWAYACKDSTAETTAEVLYRDHFLEYGMPVVIISDNGPAFRSNLFHELNRRANIQHLFTTPYNPQSNGKVERPHRVFKAALKSYVNRSHTNWDKELKSVVFAMRTTPQEGSLYSPYSLWHNREPVTPLHLLSGQWDNLDKPYSFQDAVHFQLKAARIMLKLLTKKNADVSSIFPPTADPPVWEKGQMVLVARPMKDADLSQKFLPQWSGPYKIVQRVSPTSYRLDLGNGSSVTHSILNLHPYCRSTHPNASPHLQIDIFDIDTPLYTGDPVDIEELPNPQIPADSLVVGKMALVLVDDELRVGRIRKFVDALSSRRMEIHLYDTIDMKFASQHPRRWDSNIALFPTYLTPEAGLIVKKDADVTKETPVTAIVTDNDLLDVPFDLPSTNKLNLAQRRIATQWTRGDLDALV